MRHIEALERLRAAPWLKTKATRALFAALDGEHGSTRAVGGAVRDSLIGRSCERSDIDVATIFPPDEVIARAESVGFTAYPTGIDHGTVSLRIGTQMFEVTTLRRDIETDGRHATVRFGTDWAEDAARRDFTLNALYADCSGELFDPLNGLGDCLAGKVTFIGDPDARISEDRLRVHRFFRFSASHGGQSFDRAGLAACKRAATQLDAVSAERVGVEMMRMLDLQQIAKTMRAMVRSGVLRLAPESLRHLSFYETRTDVPIAAGRLALIIGAFGADQLQGQWRLSGAEIKAAAALRDAAVLLGAGQLNEVAYRFPDIARSAVAVASAMMDWSEDWQDEVSAILRVTRVPAFPIKGHDLVEAGLKPGPALGRKLHTLERDWIDSGFQLNRDELLRRVKF